MKSRRARGWTAVRKYAGFAVSMPSANPFPPTVAAPNGQRLSPPAPQPWAVVSLRWDAPGASFSHVRGSTSWTISPSGSGTA